MHLVTGATGQVGRRIVRLIRDREEPVRAFVRLSARYGELDQRGAEIFVGELEDTRDIQRACRGVRVILSTHGSTGNPQRLDYRANIELIDAAKDNGVEHFVFISVLGADRGYEDAPIFKAKREVEKYLAASGLNYTILRPSGLASELIASAERCRDSGIYVLVGDPGNRTSIVSTDDLADIAVASMTAEGAKNRTFSVGGPDVLKREDIPSVYGRILDREPVVINVPLPVVDFVRAGVGFFDTDLQCNLGTFRTLLANEFYCTPEEIELLESTFGLKLESLEGFLRRYLGF
ncbi:putative nucleoside-diphosphate-sugar epimerase [Rubidibacter lacunae KORDI 51-2]|uniref:Putative nucleoside-diphosphate-sugar epimerase n=1 Tax=Rubidibacter lacunae KORDI 51-2 TaxID=582515 RepID=U5DM68_9CHRO|nr:SDR family oxidoreductase [Rubidibacter lacunae]ERN40810.1 putative nucleoside-diphosphate-sugar epimerase [Rubidibacter lacunae KORDI 51-2]